MTYFRKLLSLGHLCDLFYRTFSFTRNTAHPLGLLTKYFKLDFDKHCSYSACILKTINYSTACYRCWQLGWRNPVRLPRPGTSIQWRWTPWDPENLCLPSKITRQVLQGQWEIEKSRRCQGTWTQCISLWMCTTALICFSKELRLVKSFQSLFSWL